uniref:Galectin n=1 Tax=Phascolarctos cinereus TaxID=38626 RepID=A0A6P5JW34_PHACI|nr:galectin-1-like [Phascolarctos cinereus]
MGWMTENHGFTIDMGKNSNNLALHFSIRFDFGYDQNHIVFNTMVDGKFGQEVRETHFPFQKGTTVEICIEFEGNFFLVRLPDGHYLNFPNRTEATNIDYVGVFGDFVIRTFAFE